MLRLKVVALLAVHCCATSAVDTGGVGLVRETRPLTAAAHSRLPQGGDHDDVEVTVAVSTGGSAADQAALRRHAEVALWPAVLRLLEQYVRELNAC